MATRLRVAKELVSSATLMMDAVCSSVSAAWGSIEGIPTNVASSIGCTP
jgi:hypothetical protein